MASIRNPFEAQQALRFARKYKFNHFLKCSDMKCHGCNLYAETFEISRKELISLGGLRHPDKCPRCGSTQPEIRKEVYSDSSLYDYRECGDQWHRKEVTK